MRISDWSSDVCSSDLRSCHARGLRQCRSAPAYRAAHGLSLRSRRAARRIAVAILSPGDDLLDLRRLTRRWRTFQHVDHLETHQALGVRRAVLVSIPLPAQV